MAKRRHMLNTWPWQMVVGVGDEDDWMAVHAASLIGEKVISLRERTVTPTGGGSFTAAVKATMGVSPQPP